MSDGERVPQSDRRDAVDPVLDYTTEQLIEKDIQLTDQEFSRREKSYRGGRVARSDEEIIIANRERRENPQPEPQIVHPPIFEAPPDFSSTRVEDVETNLSLEPSEEWRGVDEEISERTSSTLPIPKPDIPSKQPRHTAGDLEDTILIDDPDFQPRSAKDDDAKAVAISKAMMTWREEASKEPTVPIDTKAVAEEVSDPVSDETVEIEGLPRDPRFHWVERDDVELGETIAAETSKTPQHSLPNKGSKDPQHRISEEISPTMIRRGNAAHRAKPPRFRVDKTPPEN